PLWVTVTSPGTELDAAERGIGCLGVAAAGYAEQERRTREYHRRIQSCTPVGAVVNDCATTLNFMYCHDDVREAAPGGGVRGLPTAPGARDQGMGDDRRRRHQFPAERLRGAPPGAGAREHAA